jgi:prepilin-type N-terminal cleavage/methylation domain-containing protein
MLQKLKKRTEEGFTLIELLIVVIILAILAAIVVFAVGSTAKNASVAACNSDAKSVETALESFKAQAPGGTYPAAFNWTSLTSAQTINGTTVGPWLRELPAANTSNNGYTVTADSTGGVSVQTSGGAMVNYDTTAGACNGA